MLFLEVSGDFNTLKCRVVSSNEDSQQDDVLLIPLDAVMSALCEWVRDVQK